VHKEQAGVFALISIGVSAMCTGYTSATIEFDMDVGVTHRRQYPNQYGYLPDDNDKRGNCFLLMTMMGALHNVSRSLGCAMLAAHDKMLVWYFISGELLLYLLVKAVRGDLKHWVRIESGLGAIVVAIVERSVVKQVVDFSGCLYFRHPTEEGGVIFATSVVWSQIFPFLVLQLYEKKVNNIAVSSNYD